MRKVLALLALVALLPAAAAAHDYTLGEITVDHPWSRASAGQAPNGAAYMTLTNDGESADFLIQAASPVAERVELHTHMMKDGVMEMRPVEEIQVAPGDPTLLQPGGLHVMLIGLKAPLKKDETFPLTLTFKEAGSVTVEVKVAGPGAMGPDSHH